MVTTLVLFAEKRGTAGDGRQVLQDLCAELLREDHNPRDVAAEAEYELKLWRWEGSWHLEQIMHGRPMRSVILPAKTEEWLISDLDEFLSEDTQDFYQRHGIPLR